MSKIFLLSIISIIVLFCQHNEPENQKNYDELVSAEINFAKLSESKGRRTAFMTNLHDSGLVFTPLPSLGKSKYANVKDIPAQLIWYPEYALVSESGELGFTTGPWKLSSDSGKNYTAYGHYLSLWKKFDNSWKLIVDGGIGYNEKYPWVEETKHFPINKKKQAIHSEHESVPGKPADRFFELYKSEGIVNAFTKTADKNLMIYRDEKAPVFFETVREKFSNIKILNRKHMNSGYSESEDLYYSIDVISKLINQKEQQFTSLNIWCEVNNEMRLVINFELAINVE